MMTRRMFNCLVVVILLACLRAAGAVLAQGSVGADDRRVELEKDFEAMLSGARLVGFFTLEGQAADNPLQEDEYVITKVSKQAEGVWRFEARMKYGDREFPVAIAVPVRWAGDTPVITLTDMAIPGLDTYSARVLFYRDRYAGTWSGKDHQGAMFGRIERLEESPTAAVSQPSVRIENASSNWPSFRGRNASGIGNGTTPATWNTEDGTNILWSTEIPGLAHSSPVIWGDRIYVTSAVGADVADLTVGLYGDIAPVADEGLHRFNLYCIERATGRILWERTAVEATPRIKRHPKGSHAASTPATDGKHVVAFFGSEGLHCYDTNGTLIWSKDLGVLDSGYYLVKDAQWGFASSPVLFENRVIVQCDVQENSFLAAFDIDDGSEIWRTPRTDVPTWSTPTVDVSNGRRQVIVNGWKHIGGYDLDTGEELWKLEGGGDIPVPTPVVANDLVYITNAHGRMAPIYAVRADASGIVTTEEGSAAMAWWTRSRGNYMQTPLVYENYLYCCHDTGVLACYDAATGTEMYRERLGGGRTGFTASIVAADGKIYATSEEGEIHVIRAGPAFETVAVNEMRELCMATPAISDGVIYVRGRHHLFAIGMPSKGP